MIDLISDCLIDAAKDTIKLLPFLFVTYLIMEALERHTEEKSEELIQQKNSGILGPILGALSGIVPMCGFSAAASSLYSGGLISVGTLIAVFLSTSDEMLPLLISSHVNATSIFSILVSKAVIAMITGFALDFLLKKILHRNVEAKHIHDLCEEEHCGCEEEEGGIFRSALIHTLHITVFVFLITFVLNLIMEGIGDETLKTFLAGKPVSGIFLCAAIGLIPNCASSILITTLYLEELITAAQMMSGLLVTTGLGLMILFRTNTRHMRENIKITILLYCCSVFWGLLLTLVDLPF